ncbi:MAG: hypothetical protein DMD82_08730 [Candidatus Rokuibacteriota bacterium]|nr:MAG: hypothetical protein DMD82_08730 [Candidatus Rokubacteria bacterium]
MVDRRTRRVQNFAKFSSETSDFPVELTQLPPKSGRRVPEFLACSLGGFCASPLALTIVQDSGDNACENIPALFDPPVYSRADFRVPLGADDTHRLPIRSRVATTGSAPAGG